MTQTTMTEPMQAATQATRRWPLWGVAAGATGAIATIFTTVADGRKGIDESVLDDVSRSTYHLGGGLGVVSVVCLLVLAACWRSGTQAYTSPGVRLVADCLVASAGALSLGYGWKLSMALYLPGGVNEGQFGKEGLFVYYVLNDFGPYLGWLPVVVASGAMAWVGFREGLVSRWLAAVSVLPPLVVLVMAIALGIAGFPGIVGPIWLVVAFLGLTLGRHRLTGRR
ncbi:hypothetical protein [Nocardioides sp. KR10-350]|uniref:hypothetical protein n=1 Tax=Nocardioides cheoyonin TaxID=3156615 RepID=UPI0032B391E8